MARNHLAASLLATLALGACGGRKTSAADDAAADQRLAALRTRNDSVAKARAAKATADSAAQVLYAACSDSVTAVFAKASAHKSKAPAAAPDVVAVCGQPITATLAATPAGPAVHTDSSRGANDATRAVAQRLAAEQAQADSARVAAADSLASDSLAKARETEVQRETFAYAGGSRDPFNSLMTQKSEGPEFENLQLVAVYQDLRYPSNTVAVLRDKVSTKRHNVRSGDQLGRLRVSQIRTRDVVFQINDFGFERQETLSLRKQEVVTP
ncbi:MAG: hypothetical protein ABI637_00690 [Gemmatimonadota bacterium]